MDSHDRRLGMDRTISRRDFLNGVSIAIGASLLPACGGNGESVVAVPATYYPPAVTGMRGSHAGSFEVAHATLRGLRWKAKKTDEHYDLVVVGAGISGLSAAYIYHRDVNPKARILILDNHDDFGGHATRNEFTLDGRTYIGYGGTMYMTAPETYPAVAKQVIRELGIDSDRESEFYHEDQFRLHGLDRGTFFDKGTFGADHLAIGSFGSAEMIRGAPLSAPAKVELERLFADEKDYLAGMTPSERRTIVESHNWRDYLAKIGGFGEEVLAFIQQWPHDNYAIGADAFPAWLAWLEGFPGFAGMDLGYGDEDSGEDGDEEYEESDEDGGEEYEERGFYFPDGNASIARLLIRKLIPGIAPGNSMEDIVTARFDYSRLDREENLTRVRLRSTVVGVQHQDGKLDADVDLTYVSGNEGRRVSAHKVIWAGYHSMLPHICPDLPADQAAAQVSSVRAPLVYTNVLIRNWRSFVNLGLEEAYCSGSFFSYLAFTHPVSMGDYRFNRSPDEPVILHLQNTLLAPGLPAAEQFLAGRQALLQTSFETFERNARDQLGRMLGPGGFDSARDIAGITVNRWPHGYAYSVDTESGDVSWWSEWWHHKRSPWVDARQRVGNIAFAGIDAASNAMTESAIEEAHRAIHSLGT